MKAVPDWVIQGLPIHSARTVLSRGQALCAALLIMALGGALCVDASKTFLWLNTSAIVLYLVFTHYKLILQFISLGEQPPALLPQEGSEFEWPAYTILVPLYHEQEAVAGLLEHLGQMHYPKDRLRILLLVEQDDPETRAALQACQPGPQFETIVVPVSEPRTKAKACNYGLRLATGNLLVIYDAEDRPDRDQLKKAAFLLSKVPEDVICLQARLDFYNPTRNITTRLFTAEYASWFDLCLPALHLLDAPMPLGGTSNHFRLSALRQLKGWDPFNVAEDCDLGVRLYIRGYRTLPLDSTTWEEATSRLGPWVRQRSRWVKGYLQTYLVHLRNQLPLLRRRELQPLCHFHMIFGAGCFCLLMNPFFWTLTALWLLTRAEMVSRFYPLWVLIPALLSFLAGNAAFVLSGMLACLARRKYGLIPYCLLAPLYWVLMSVAAWRGALQLITRPFYWEKTPHEGTRALEGEP